MGHSVRAGTRRARGGMHYRPRKCSTMDDQGERDQLEQDQAARRAARDVQYRRALGLDAGPLPTSLGACGGHGRLADNPHRARRAGCRDHAQAAAHVWHPV